MKKSLKFQFISMLSSKGFNISVLILCIYSIAVPIYYGIKFTNGDINEVPAAYAFFIGSSLNEIPSRIFYTIMPLMVVLPFADSYFCDRENKTIYAVLSRCSVNDYYFGKLICVFASGFIVIFTPLILNFILNLLIFPFDSTIEFYMGFGQIQNQLYSLRDIGVDIIFRSLFFSNHYLYELVYMIIASLFGGLFSVIVYQFSFFFRGNRIILNSLFFIIFNVLNLVFGIVKTSFCITLDCYIISDRTYGEQNYLVFFALIAVCILCAFAPIPFAKKKMLEII